MILCLAFCVRKESAVSALSTKYVVETGSGFQTQSGILTLTLNSTSSPTRVDLMPGVDEITPITEYLVHEQDSLITSSQITGASVSWTRAGDQTAVSPSASTSSTTVPVSIRIAEVQVHQTSGGERTTRKFCTSDWLLPDRLYPLTQC